VSSLSPPALSLVAGLCHYEPMAKTVIVKLTDDLDGSDADETVHFSLDGKSYEIDVSAANATRLRDAFKPFLDKARPVESLATSQARTPKPSPSVETMYSKLGPDEKARFRAWAGMPNARRISDARVTSWIAAGKP
jgi:nucleoid-associated protein Lsr2